MAGVLRWPAGLPAAGGRETLLDHDEVGLQDGCAYRRINGAAQRRIRRGALELQFDELGRDGWELSWILMNQSLHGEKDGHVVIFKRPLADEQAPQPNSRAEQPGQ